MFDRTRTVRPSPATRPGRGRPRLTLELLEGRLSPATLTVNSIADTVNATDPYLSLREAIAIVNSPRLPDGLSDQILAQISGTLHDGGADTIAFDPTGVTGPIFLGGTQLELSLPASTAAVTLDGGSGVTVDANNASRVLQVDAGVQATLEHLTITHGRTSGSGGGISNSGTLTLAGSTVSANSATGSGTTGFGGGLYNASGTVTVADSTLSTNSAYHGGGIFNATGSLTVSDSTLRFNYTGADGGGLFNDSGTVTVSNSTLFADSVVYSGGGIFNFTGSMTVSNSTLSADFAVQDGGGIDNSGTLIVTDSTLTGNTGSYGGGINNISTLTVSSSTLSDNSAVQGGGIVTNISPFQVLLWMQNTIVAGNRARAGPDIDGRLSFQSSYNLVGDGTGLEGISTGMNHNQIGTAANPIDPLLGWLDFYGGPTQTLALLAGSPALEAGDPGEAGNPDQRGVVRTGGVNIGAFQASAASLKVIRPFDVTAGRPFDVTAETLDPYGQPAVGYTGTVTFSSADPYPATLPPDYTFTLADGGAHTFPGMTALYTAGTWDVTVTDAANGLNGSANVQVQAGAAVAFQVMAPSSALSGMPFDVTVVAVDAYGNTATGYAGTIHFSTSDHDPGVVLPPDYTFGPSDNGLVTFPAGVTLVTSGDQTLTVTDLDTGISGSTVVHL